jgi:hypothetical protein
MSGAVPLPLLCAFIASRVTTLYIKVFSCLEHTEVVIWYDIYLLQLGFHPVAVVGRPVQK